MYMRHLKLIRGVTRVTVWLPQWQQLRGGCREPPTPPSASDLQPPKLQLELQL